MNVLILSLLLFVPTLSHQIHIDEQIIIDFTEGIIDSLQGANALIQSQNCRNNILLNQKSIREAIHDMTSFKVRKIIQGCDLVVSNLRKILPSCISASKADSEWFLLLNSEFNPSKAKQQMETQFRNIVLLLANAADEANTENWTESGRKFGEALKIIWFS